MARLRASRRHRGGTIVGFLAGLIIGLMIAVVVAIFVTRAPVPFVNKVGKANERIEPKAAADAPDPNKPLYSKSRPATSADPAPAPVAVAPATAPVVAAPPSSLPSAPGIGPAPPKVADADRKDATSYLLQAGAFRSQDDADVMKAKLALMGFEARILNAEVNGQTVYRVRVGPYAQLDDMNRARAKLAQSGVEASVVRQR